MRSERRALALLRSQGLGVACGLATVALLAVGSFVLAATRDGASGVALDDLTAFFARPSPAHAWLYLLLPVVALYGLNTALATWDSVTRKWRGGVRAPSAYGPALVHVGFLAAMLAHLVGGLAGGDRGEVVLTEGAGFEPLAGGRSARLEALEVDRLPGGMPREVRAALEVREADGRTEREVVGYNRPLSRGGGSDLHLLADTGEVPLAELEVAGARCAAAAGGRCRAGAVEVVLEAVAPPGAVAVEALARVAVDGRPLVLAAGRDAPLPDGRPVRLVAVRSAGAVLLRSRSAPGHPLALAGAVVTLAGLAAMGRRFSPRRPGAVEEDGAAEPGAVEEAASGGAR